MPGTNTRAVAEMALLLMLACLRRLPLLDRATREGRGWRLSSEIQDSYGELAGRTVGRVAAAGLDVFAAEPVGAGEPLLELDNVVLTPHLAWLTAGTLRRSLEVAVENCRRLGEGEPLLHRIV